MPVPRAVLEDLFETKLTSPPRAAVEDIGLRDERIGLGFPHERHDLKCPECGAGMKLRTSKHGLFYGCEAYPACKCTHGAHNDGSPLGTPGNRETRKARIYAHRIFDRLWKAKVGEKPHMSRHQAYAWMRKTMGLSDSEGHLGSFTTEQCNMLVAHVLKKYPGVRNAWDKLAGDKELFADEDEVQPSPRKAPRKK